MDASLFSFRKLFKLVKTTSNSDITQTALLFSTLVYFSNEFILKIAQNLGIESLNILEVNGLKALYLTYNGNRYVAFRGTEFSMWSNTKRILNFLPKRNPAGRKAHRGFVMAFADLKKLIDPLIFKPKSVIFTGHSLGGALSILAAEHYEGYAITFASPKVYFNENIKNKISHVGYRIENDPVPLLPPTMVFMEWSRPALQFVWKPKKKFLNFTKHHHLSEYIENVLGLINERNNSKAAKTSYNNTTPT